MLYCLMQQTIVKTGWHWIPTPLADNVDIENTVVSVVPTHGAVVRADYKTRVECGKC